VSSPPVRNGFRVTRMLVNVVPDNVPVERSDDVEASCIEWRAATKADQDAEEVIFYIADGRSVPYWLGRELPLGARLISTEEDTGFPVGTEIEILQAELGDTGDVLIGFMVGEEEGICQLNEIELID
jgi:hypothetical protein